MCKINIRDAPDALHGGTIVVATAARAVIDVGPNLTAVVGPYDTNKCPRCADARQLKIH
jgi:hypothetical protein